MYKAVTMFSHPPKQDIVVLPVELALTIVARRIYGAGIHDTVRMSCSLIKTRDNDVHSFLQIL